MRRVAVKLDGEFPVGGAEPLPHSPSKPPGRNAEPRGSEKADSVVINTPLDFELKSLDANHPYLSERGFLPETVTWFGLGYCGKGLMKGRIAIPLHDAAGNLIGYAGRLVDEETLSTENPRYKLPGSREKDGIRHQFEKSRFLYNGHRIPAPVDDLIIVEGFPSVWWLHQCGFPHAVALMGASCSKDQAELIAGLTAETGRVWLLPDGDEGGKKCAEGALPLLASRRFCRWVELPSGKQPTDFGGTDLRILFALK